MRKRGLKQILQEIGANPQETSKHLRNWIAEHDELPEIPGSYIKTPMFFRMQEREKLIVPNLREIIESHFYDHPKPLDERILMDIGAWGGHLTAALSDLFGHIIAVEPHSARFEQLRERQSAAFKPLQLDVREMIKNPTIFPYKADVLLMSHILYFLKFEEDEQALLWAQSALNPDGISISILNDMVPDPGTRAHVRKELGVREANPNPTRYRDYLTRRGFSVDVMRPALRVESQTPEGLEATKDIMRYLLPGEARANENDLEAYAQKYIKGRGTNGGNAFQHLAYMLVGHENPQASKYVPQSGGDE